MPRPRVQGFVFTWKGHAEHAARLERELAAVMPVMVINSEPDVAAAHPSWITLDDSAYFAAQWNAAIARFDADILFHMQADAWSDRLPDIVRRASRLFEQYPLGMYEPNVDFTDHVFEQDKLPAIEPGLCQVPFTDTTCWMVARDVLERMPAFDLSVNQYGWGVSRLAAALCSLMHRYCVRDFTFLVAHPRGRGYDSSRAHQELLAHLRSMPADIIQECQRLHDWSRTLRPAPQTNQA